LLHRHIASIQQGRWLTSSEIVHHIDENKLNNDPGNLEVLTKSAHSKIHAKSPRPEQVCLNCGQLFVAKQAKIKYCTANSCNSSYRIKNKEITKEIIESLLPFNTWVSLGALLGYSDTGIKKRAIALGCNLKLKK
jgi:hypothetical protein